MHDEVKLYFSDSKLRVGCAYCKVVVKAHGAVEIREYWQTEDIKWLERKKE